MDKILLSEEGYNKVKDELKYLKEEIRDEIAERLKTAKEHGDLSENAEYDEAKNANEQNELRISELEDILKNADIIDEKKIKKNIIQVGSTIELTELSNNVKNTFKLVSAPEANFAEKKISEESPLGKALLGNKKGDIVYFEAPKGRMEYKIENISYDM